MKTFTYAELTVAAEAQILFYVGVQHTDKRHAPSYLSSARGVLHFWDRLTNGSQKYGDHQRLKEIIDGVSS